MADINVNVVLPDPISIDVTSPTQALATNVSIPGPQGPAGIQGPSGAIGPSGALGPSGARGAPTTINSLIGENIIITGTDGNIVSTNGIATIYISGNSGYFQSAINSLTTNLTLTGANLNTSIISLSGLFTGHTGSLDNNYATDAQLQSTGSNLYTLLTNFSGNLDANYATDTQLFNTGSSLDGKINSLSGYSASAVNLASTGSNLYTLITNFSGNLDADFASQAEINALSGYVNSQDTSISNNLRSTGSTLDNRINSLSGWSASAINLTSTGATLTTNLFNTGSNLNTKIDNLSGYVNFQDTNISNNLTLTGSTLISNINSLNSAFTGFTGNLDANYATDLQLFNTGSTLDNKINSLSGYSASIINLQSTGSNLYSMLTGFSGNLDATYATDSQLTTTGSTLDNKINSLSGWSASSMNLATTGSTLVDIINSLSGTLTGNYVTKFNGQFTNRPTVNGTGILLSGEAAALPTTILYTTGNQIKSGRLAIGDTIVDENYPYTLSIQSNNNNTWLEILNHSGSNKGVFFGIEGNDFEQYNWQAGDIKFFTSENFSNGTERLRIKNDGKVGIGTSTPSEKLEVAGNIIANNLVYNTGNQTISGNKSFAQDTTFGDSAQGDFLVISGNQFTVYGSGNFTSGLFVNGNAVLTGVDLSSYATVANLASTGNTLDSKINSLSGVTVLTYSNQTINGLKDFTTRPTVNTTPVLLSGENANGLTVLVKNDESATLLKGQPVYIYGANGNNILVRKASNTGEAYSSKTLGLLAQDLTSNAQGFVITEGALEGINTNGGNAGDPIWLGPTGDLIFGLANKPYAPNHLVYLGVIERKQSNNGKVYVKVQNGFELQELHNVNIDHKNTLNDNDILRYNSASGLWFNETLNTGIFQTQINSLSGSSVLLYGDQSVGGVKTFRDNVYINNLFVTGAQTVVSTNNFSVQSPYLLLNLTGGAVDGGIFFVTGAGLTGANDSGPIIGFDHSNKFKFGVTTRNSDLSTLPDIASVQNITTYSGFVDGKYATIINLVSTGSTLSTNLASTGSTLQTNINNLSNTYATITNLVSTGSTLDTKINNLSGYINSSSSNIVFTTGDQTISGIKTFIGNHNIRGNTTVSGFINISGNYDLYSQIENSKKLAIAYAIAL